MYIGPDFLAVVLLACATAHPLHNDLADDTVRRIIDARPRSTDSDEALIRDTARVIQTAVEVGAQLAQVPSDIRSKHPLHSVAVAGRLLCDGEPAAGVELKLYDHDSKGTSREIPCFGHFSLHALVNLGEYFRNIVNIRLGGHFTYPVGNM